MQTITIPLSLQSAFGVSEQTKVYDEQGNLLGYYTPLANMTDADYEWLVKQFSPADMEAALNSGPCRPASEIIPELRRKHGS